jgi:hypothetical protein
MLSRRQANLAPRLRPAKLFLLGTSGVRTAGEPARFVLIAPLPPTTGIGEDFQSAHWLRDSIMCCVHPDDER